MYLTMAITAASVTSASVTSATTRMERCQHILAAVSNLSATETDELFKILASTKCEYSRNDNGIFINLRWVDEGVLHKIEQFMAFCTKNRIELEKYEKLRKLLTENFAIASATAAAAADTDTECEILPRTTAAAPATTQAPAIIGGMTTLKFNLLKKKFAKPFNASSRFEQGDLMKESPLIGR